MLSWDFLHMLGCSEHCTLYLSGLQRRSPSVCRELLSWHCVHEHHHTRSLLRWLIVAFDHLDKHIVTSFDCRQLWATQSSRRALNACSCISSLNIFSLHVFLGELLFLVTFSKITDSSVWRLQHGLAKTTMVSCGNDVPHWAGEIWVMMMNDLLSYYSVTVSSLYHTVRMVKETCRLQQRSDSTQLMWNFTSLQMLIICMSGLHSPQGVGEQLEKSPQTEVSCVWLGV